MNRMIDAITLENFFATLVAVAAISIILILAYSSQSFVTNRQCLKSGYRESKVTWTFEAYCLKIEDGSEAVVPLSEIKR